MKNTVLEHDEVRETVRQRYGQIALAGGAANGSGCCAAPDSSAEALAPPAACCGGGSIASVGAELLGYSAEEAGAAPEGANLGLGCGNPLAIASLRPGQSVLDLGSGAGFDAFLAARAVGPTGRVIGVDMTPAMVSKARGNQARSGLSQVEFRLGEIEHLPVADATIDVILSNCVINLSPDKAQVFRETFRVLKPGGRLAISDVVALAPIPAEVRRDWDLLTGCVAGASSAIEIEAMLRSAGFTDIRIAPKDRSREIVGQWFPGRKIEEMVASATIEAVKPPSAG